MPHKPCDLMVKGWLISYAILEEAATEKCPAATVLDDYDWRGARASTAFFTLP